MDGLGYLPDIPHHKDYSWSRYTLTEDPPPGTVSLRQYRQERWYQGPVGSCVAFSVARAAHIVALASGQTLRERPSPMWIYSVARMQEYAGVHPKKIPPLEDGGSRPRLALDACRALGLVPESVWPYRAEDATKKPTARVQRAAHDKRGLSWYRIDSRGEERIQDIRRALHNNHVPIFGTAIDSAFKAYRGGVIDSINLLDVTGGHAMAVLEHNSLGIVVDNWWRSWVGDGTATISDRLFGSLFGDFLVIGRVNWFRR